MKANFGIFLVFLGLVASPLSSFAKTCDELLEAVKKTEAGDLVEFAIETQSQAYVYPSHGKRFLPVMALQKQHLGDYLEEFGEDTISFVYRSDTWHSYMRLGKLLIDLNVTYYANDPDRNYKSVRIRNANTVFKKSKSTEWKEGVLRLDKKTVQMMQWFFLYRSELFKLHNKDKLLECAWDMEFNDRPRNYQTTENCATFVMSPFVALFHEDLPSAADQKLLRENVSKVSLKKLPFSISGQPPTLATVVNHLKKAAKTYGFDKYPPEKVKSQQGELRLVNIHPNAVGYVLHNQDFEGFVRETKMGFAPRTPSKDPIDQPFDTKITERISLEDLEE